MFLLKNLKKMARAKLSSRKSIITRSAPYTQGVASLSITKTERRDLPRKDLIMPCKFQEKTLEELKILAREINDEIARRKEGDTPHSIITRLMVSLQWDFDKATENYDAKALKVIDIHYIMSSIIALNEANDRFTFGLSLTKALTKMIIDAHESLGNLVNCEADWCAVSARRIERFWDRLLELDRPCSGIFQDAMKRVPVMTREYERCGYDSVGADIFEVKLSVEEKLSGDELLKVWKRKKKGDRRKKREEIECVIDLTEE
jgi:hypothetical protein